MLQYPQLCRRRVKLKKVYMPGARTAGADCRLLIADCELQSIGQKQDGRIMAGYRSKDTGLKHSTDKDLQQRSFRYDKQGRR